MRRLVLEVNEAIRIALAQIRSNKLRSALTALGVIIGIVSVTLMGTAIAGIDAGVERSLAGMGDDVFYVTKWPWRGIEDWWNYRNRRPVRMEYAQRINEYVAGHPNSLLKRAVPASDRMTNLVRGDLKLLNIYTLGVGHELPLISRTNMEQGRFFSEAEARGARNVVVIGFDVADALFPSENPVGQKMRIADQEFQVIGTVARQGKFLGLFSMDSMVILPIDTFRRYFALDGNSTQIRVQVVDPKRMDDAREELRGLMRALRQVSPEVPDDFEINEQKVIREQLDPIKKGIAIGGLAITGLALFVGAIGIMNITFVSVKERTKEIGTRKALGARRRTILVQFLIEASSISLVGGVLGLMLTWILTQVIAVAAPSFPIVFSPMLVVVGLAVSVLAGILSGFVPAWQASKLDPVVALRYE
ncbi:ABC transporter permease [Nibricoccus sp. IMCC34717]|uniref:ABC transporter permease n=1 Tax=Nibricoccus sp. IMCC34717 TaxID=3034021 RepID=UPI00384BA190